MYDKRVEDARRRYQPEDSLELDQVMLIVNSNWLLARLKCVASDLMCQGAEKGTSASDAYVQSKISLDGLSRYQGSLTRALDKAIKRLQELKRDARLYAPKEEITKRTESPEPPTANCELPTGEAEETESPELPAANCELPTGEAEPEELQNEAPPAPFAPHASRSTPSPSPAPKVPFPNPVPLFPPSVTPLETVIAHYEKHNEFYSLIDLLSQGYRYRHPEKIYIELTD
jgi:hypothetical protein